MVPVALDAMTVDSNLEANSLKDESRKPANVAQKHPAKHNRKQKAIALNQHKYIDIQKKEKMDPTNNNITQGTHKPQEPKPFLERKPAPTQKRRQTNEQLTTGNSLFTRPGEI